MQITVTIGGKAGEGIKRTANIIARIFNRMGYNVFVYEDYPSLIKGGHNFATISVSNDEIHTHYTDTDVLMAFDENTIINHEKELKNKSAIIYDSIFSYNGKNKAYATPMTYKTTEMGGKPIMANSVGIGALAKLFSIDFSIIEKVFNDVYGSKAELNIKLAKEGYDGQKELFFKVEKTGKEPKPLLNGNMACGLGMVKAGLQFYIAYPMTPASSILHFLSEHDDELNISVFQPENEIAVAVAAIGASYAGARTAVASSGGGFALMVEALSFAGIAETPVVFIESQRGGPSTGVPTYNSQADLLFVSYSGHGEFPRIVLAPGDIEECYYMSADAMNLAWKYQVPVLLMLDKHLSESTKSVKIDENIKIEKPKTWNGKEPYKRFEITHDGISPIAFPGTAEMVKTTSYEHDEYGYTVEDAESIAKMVEKRDKKWKTIQDGLTNVEKIKLFGDLNSDNVIVTWGSSKGMVLEALKNMKSKAKVIQIIYMVPFPSEDVLKHLKNAKKVVCVEQNLDGQLAKLVSMNIGYEIKNKIGRHDTRVFDPVKLANEIEEVFA